MILLNRPWRIYDRQMELERRRLAVRIATIHFLWACCGLALGIAIGLLAWH